jgi:hypothetical protein
MSYLIDDEKVTQPVKMRDHRGEKNPHFGHVMQQSSRDAIAASQRARYDYYRKAAANIVTEDRVREIITETIRDYFNRNAIETKNNRPNNIPL